MPDQDTPSTPEPTPAPRPPLFALRNHHAWAPDVPPAYFETASFVSVFENIYGEQWVFTWRHNQPYGVLWGGDVDWKPEKIYGPHSLRWTMGEEEQLWFTVCWFTAAPSHHPNKVVREVASETGALKYLATGRFGPKARDGRPAGGLSPAQQVAAWRRDPEARELIDAYNADALRAGHKRRFDEGWAAAETMGEEEARAWSDRRRAEADAEHAITPEEWAPDSTSS